MSKRTERAHEWVRTWLKTYPGRRTELQRAGELFIAYEQGYEDAINDLAEVFRDHLIRPLPDE